MKPIYFFLPTADVSQTLQVVLAGWFYVSPIIYNLDFVPQRFRFYFRFNPMVYILDGFRVAIYNGQLPSLRNMAMNIGCALATLFVGYRLFVRYQNKLVFYL